MIEVAVIDKIWLRMNYCLVNHKKWLINRCAFFIKEAATKMRQNSIWLIDSFSSSSLEIEFFLKPNVVSDFEWTLQQGFNPFNSYIYLNSKMFHS